MTPAISRIFQLTLFAIMVLCLGLNLLYAEDQVEIEGNSLTIVGSARSESMTQSSVPEKIKTIEPKPIDSLTAAKRKWGAFNVSRGMTRAEVEKRAGDAGILRARKYSETDTSNLGRWYFWIFEYEYKTGDYKFVKQVKFDGTNWKVLDVVDSLEDRY